MEKLYLDFDNLFIETDEVIIYANDNSHMILKRENDIKHTRYSGNDDGLGFVNPSLVIDKITSGYKKGRPLKARPASKSYSIYDFAENMTPIRIQEINSFGRIVSTYFFEYNHAVYAVPFSENRVSVVDGGVYKMEYSGNRIMRISHICGNSLWQENYDYASLANGLITCDQYYYVPDLKNSSKMVPVGEHNSPAQLMRMKIYTENDSKVVKIDCYQLNQGMEVHCYTYEK